MPTEQWFIINVKKNAKKTYDIIKHPKIKIWEKVKKVDRQNAVNIKEKSALHHLNKLFKNT